MYSEDTWSNKALISLCTISIAVEFITIFTVTALIVIEEGSFDTLPIGDIILLICISLTLALEPLILLLKSYRALYPWIYTSFQALKTTFAGLFTAYEIVRFIKHGNTHLFPLDSEQDVLNLLLVANAALVGVLCLLFCGSLTYGAVVMHRYRKSIGYEDLE